MTCNLDPFIFIKEKGNTSLWNEKYFFSERDVKPIPPLPIIIYKLWSWLIVLWKIIEEVMLSFCMHVDIECVSCFVQY